MTNNEFTPTEAQYILLLVAGQAVQPINPQTGALNDKAGDTVAMLHSIATKCHATIRTSEPLAWAATKTPDRKKGPAA